MNWFSLIPATSCTSRFDVLHETANLARLNAVDEAFAQGREHVVLQRSGDHCPSRVDPCRGSMLEPRSAHGFQRVVGPGFLRCFCLFARGARIDAIGDQLPRFIAARAGRLQRDSLIDPERQPLFLAAMPVLEAPSLATAWGHLDIKPAAIEEANSLVSELGVADRSVRKGHRGNSRIVGGNWTRMLPPTKLGYKWTSLGILGLCGETYL